MSRENVETVRRVFEAYAETGDIDVVLPFHTEDLVVHSMAEWPDDPVYYGRDGLRKLNVQWKDNFDDFGFELCDVREGDDAVVALVQMVGRVKGVGLQMKTELGAAMWFRDGLVSQIRYFSKWQDALGAAGVPE